MANLNITHERFDAEKVLLYVQECLREWPGIAHNAKFEATRSAVIDSLILQIRSWCVAGRVPERVETEVVEYPDGTWQMFKSVHMPQWFVNKFPVRMVRKEIVTQRHNYFMCPHLVTDSRDTHVGFMMNGSPQRRF